jgi:putative aldouronate transport system substrate-binding protein
VPQTTAEFKDYLIAIRDGDLNNNGRNDEIPLISDNSGTGDPIFFIMNSFEPTTRNFYKISDDGKIIFAADKDGWREGLRYMNELYEEQLFYAEETYTQGGDALKALVNMDPEGDFLVGAISHFWQGNFVDISVLNWTDFAPIPPLEGPDGTREVPASGPVFRLVSAITTNCQYPEVAIKWLDFWASEEGAFANNYGFIEGHGYEWTDEMSYAGEPRSIRTIAQENIRWGASMVPKNDKFAEIRYIVTDVVEDRDKVANIHVLNEAAAEHEPYYVPHNVPQVNWSTPEVLTAMTEQRTLINDYVKQAYTEFILGIRNIDSDWDRYLADLNAMGLEGYLELLRTHHGLN